MQTKEQERYETLPPELEREDVEARNELDRVMRETTMGAIIGTGGITEDDVQRALQARFRVVESMRKLALKLTKPEDWTLWADREGHVVATPRASAMLRVRPYFQVSVYHHRGVDGKPGVPTVSTVDKNGSEVTVLEMLADVRVGAQVMEGIYCAVRSDDEFIGRANRAERLGGPRPQDLWAVIRTSLDKKCIAVALGLTKIPEDELRAAGIDTSRCYRGAGYGTSAERSAGRVVDEGVAQKADELRDEILRRVGGDTAAARELLREITASPPTEKNPKGFAGFDSTKKLTKSWQLENAWKRLREHAQFGDHGREAGSDG